MTSKIVVNNIEADAGVSTVTFGSEISASTFNGNIVGTSATFSGNVNVAGVLTYEDVTSVDAVGLSTFQNGIHVTGGSVGIGTDNPQEKLQVQGDVRLVDNSPRIGFHDANASTNIQCTGGIEIFDQNGNRGAYMGATEGSNFLSFGISPSAGANPTEKLRITSDGKIGINSTSPSAETMDIVGDAPKININSTNGSSGFRLNIIQSSSQLFRVQNAGTTAFEVNSNGNTLLANGNLVFSTSGTGIDFSAASGSAAGSTSALLDDYEEGTFSPTAFGNSTAGTTTYGLQYGAYVKIGNLCHFQVRMQVTSMTGTGDLRLGGLPFTVFSDYERGYGSIAVGYLDSLTFGHVSDTHLTLYTNANDTHVVVRSSGNNRPSTSVPVDNNFVILYGGTYRTV